MADLDASAPVACSLGADRGAQIERWAALLSGVAAEPVNDGVQYRLPIARVESAARVAADEQACCPFFSFDLALRGDVVVLTIRTPLEGAAMLAEITGHSGQAGG